MVQSLLLIISSNYVSLDGREPWDWLGLAISLSYDAGLHRAISPTSEISAKRKSLHKRAWWSCLVYDRLIAISAGKPTRIKREDCTVPMLHISDLLITTHSSIGSEMSEIESARLYIEKVMLCWCTSGEDIQALRVLRS